MEEVAINSTSEKPIPHYYGDTVRRFFLACGLVMLLTLPFVATRVPYGLVNAIALIVLLAIFSGVTNPRVKAIMVLDLSISAIGFIYYAYYAAIIYLQNSVNDILFWVDLVISVFFFFALYFATKSVRGEFLIKGKIE